MTDEEARAIGRLENQVSNIDRQLNDMHSAINTLTADVRSLREDGIRVQASVKAGWFVASTIGAAGAGLGVLATKVWKML